MSGPDRGGIVSDRRYRLAAERSTVWAQLLDVAAYPSRWPWLETFDGRVLAPGETWRCLVRSPLRLTLRFEVRVRTVIAEATVGAEVDGDLTGPATLRLADVPGGTELRLTSALVPRSAALARVGGLVPPVARWAHDRLVDTAFAQFRDDPGGVA